VNIVTASFKTIYGTNDRNFSAKKTGLQTNFQKLLGSEIRHAIIMALLTNMEVYEK